MPKDRRKEVAEQKKNITEYADQKEKRMFIKRRAKLLRTHWRNGIAGLTNPADEDNDQIKSSHSTS